MSKYAMFSRSLVSEEDVDSLPRDTGGQRTPISLSYRELMVGVLKGRNGRVINCGLFHRLEKSKYQFVFL